MEVGCEITGDPRDRHGIGSIRIDLEVVEHVLFHAQRLAQRGAGLVAVAEDQDAAGVAGQAELGR